MWNLCNVLRGGLAHTRVANYDFDLPIDSTAGVMSTREGVILSLILICFFLLLLLMAGNSVTGDWGSSGGCLGCSCGTLEILSVIMSLRLVLTASWSGEQAEPC